MSLKREIIVTEPESSFRCFVRQLREFPFEWHSHTEYELTAITRGHGRRLVGNHAADYAAPDLVLTGPNLPHTWHSAQAEGADDHANEAIVLQFADDFMGDLFFDRPGLSEISRLLTRSERGLVFGEEVREQAVAEMREIPSADAFGRLMRLLSVLHVLACTEDRVALSTRALSSEPNAAAEERFNDVYQYMLANYAERISVEAAAALVNMSVSAFSRFFKRSSGRTFVTCLNEIRVGAACQMLSESDRSITDICHESGFSNLSNFNRQFRRFRDMAPSTYRCEFLGGAE